MNEQQEFGQFLLSIEAIPPQEKGAQPGQAYFVGSTAPNNVEDGFKPVKNPTKYIKEIAKFLQSQQQPEVLIVIHGYNTALGDFTPNPTNKKIGFGVKGWYQNIWNYISQSYPEKSKSLVFVGYRWPSEEIKGLDTDTLWNKILYAQSSLPIALKALFVLAIAILVTLSIISRTTHLLSSANIGIMGVGVSILAIIAIMVISMVFSLFLLRIVGYFRDSYRANHFGVPDLVEFIRQLNKAVVEVREESAQKGKETPRIKLSFIGHSMGAFVVTNTVRILSDVFNRDSIGALDIDRCKVKRLTSEIGDVFSLGRLVLVAPDIPTETLISGRANFLGSSLRRFTEAYLFCNEGDLALKLASTAANYFSFPSKTREGGSRLGNAIVRIPDWVSDRQSKYGIINLDSEGNNLRNDINFLDYLYIRPGRSLMQRQAKITRDTNNLDLGQEILGDSGNFLKDFYIKIFKFIGKRRDQVSESEQTLEIKDRQREENQNSVPEMFIAEMFTVFDCTDYQETLPNRLDGTKVGILSQALGKRWLNFCDYVKLTYDVFTGKIDTHNGYFYYIETTKDGSVNSSQLNKPEALFSRHLIYGLACLGLHEFLLENQKKYPEETGTSLQILSTQCANHGLWVLLAKGHSEMKK